MGWGNPRATVTPVDREGVTRLAFNDQRLDLAGLIWSRSNVRLDQMSPARSTATDHKRIRDVA